MVREFYINASPEGPAVVQVRGRSVAFGSQAINALFAKPSYEGRNYMEQGLRRYDLDEIIRSLCKLGTTWKTNDMTCERTTFPHSALNCYYGKAWFNFVCANMIPTHHLSNMTKDRTILLFTIITGLDVDIGVLIHESILKAIKSATSMGLLHPSLITRLYKRAGIHWGPEEIALPTMFVIDHQVISRFNVWDGATSHVRGEGYGPPTEPPPTSESEHLQPQHVGPASQGLLAELMASLTLLHQNQDANAQR